MTRETDLQRLCYACLGKLRKLADYDDVWTCTKCKLHTDESGMEIDVLPETDFDIELE